MKTTPFTLIATALMSLFATAQNGTTYVNFIRQVQFPSGVQWDATIAASGEQLSNLAIDPGGARFELWTVQSAPLASYILDSRYVGTYIPMAEVTLRSEDGSSTIPRTRADRPFYVDVTVEGLHDGESEPEASKKVRFLRHVQSYGANGTGIGIDRTQATLVSQSFINKNGSTTLTYLINAVPGANRAKVRGEERFSIFSLEDYQAPASQLASRFIQIWPVADGTISGIVNDQFIRYNLPQLTLTLNDLYPNSTTYAQVYKGNPSLGTNGTIVPGSALVIQESVPQNRVLTLKNYESVFDSDGRWTMEIVTKTPFGTDRLAYVSFDIDRTMKLNTNMSTIE
ncbi:MAG: hypothetical protein ACK49I_06865 [Verrucomicrobiota bacterium]